MSVYVYFWLMLCIGFGLGMGWTARLNDHPRWWLLLLLQIPVAAYVVVWLYAGVKL